MQWECASCFGHRREQEPGFGYGGSRGFLHPVISAISDVVGGRSRGRWDEQCRFGGS
jgi:hypothetical protein